MSDFLSMFNYNGKTAKVLGKTRINTYKDIYLHIQNKQGSDLKYDGNYFFPAFKDLVDDIIPISYYEASDFGQSEVFGNPVQGEPNYRELKKQLINESLNALFFAYSRATIASKVSADNVSVTDSVIILFWSILF